MSASKGALAGIAALAIYATPISIAVLLGYIVNEREIAEERAARHEERQNDRLEAIERQLTECEAAHE